MIQPKPPEFRETASDRLQGLAMVLFLVTGFALGVSAMMSTSAQRQLGGTLDLVSAVGGRTAAAVNRVMAHDLPIDAALREAGGVLRWRLFASGGPQVWVGEHGWLFLMEELRPFPDADAAMRFRVDALARIRDGLAARGIALVVAVVPDKARIVASEMDGPRSAQAEARYGELAGMLAAARIPSVDLLRAFEAAPIGQTLYYRTDTHWNQPGAALAARAIAAGVTAPIDRSHRFETRADPQETRLAGDLLRLMSLDRVPDDLPVALRPAPDVQHVEHTVDLTPAAPAGGLLDDGPKVDVALIGSSFSVNANFAGRLAEALKTPVANFALAGGAFAGAARAYLGGDTFRESPPGLIVWEFPERVMGQPLGDDDKTLLSLPVSLHAGAGAG